MTHWRFRPPVTERSLSRFRALWVGVTAALLIAAGVVFTVGAARGQTSGSVSIGSATAGPRTITLPPAEPKDGACPPERPHKRTTTIYPQSTMCTTMACAPKLVCGKDTDRCAYVPTNDCNRCSPEPRDVEICLSSEELERAR